MRFYVDDIILSERLPGFDTTPSLTLMYENGPGTTVGVALAAIPSHPLVFNLASSDPSVFTLTTTSLTFTPDNWNTPVVVGVVPTDDNLPVAVRTANITFSKGSTLDLYYAGSQTPLPSPIPITVLDPNLAGITVTTSSLTLDESVLGTTTTTASLVLSTPPVHPVQIAVASGDPTVFTVSPTLLTFTSANWNTPQIVTLTSVDDNLLANGVDRTAPLQFTVLTADSTYSLPSLVPPDETVEVLNNGLPVRLSHISVE